MPQWNYWHRVEYRREVAKDQYALEHTEVVEDEGWMHKRKGVAPEAWFVYYTRGCAEDFLSRAGARSGTWIVAVWHTGMSGHGKGRLRGSVRIRWPG
jgi:hypothetical protein